MSDLTSKVISAILTYLLPEHLRSAKMVGMKRLVAFIVFLVLGVPASGYAQIPTVPPGIGGAAAMERQRAQNQGDSRSASDNGSESRTPTNGLAPPPLPPSTSLITGSYSSAPPASQAGIVKPRRRFKNEVVPRANPGQ
jgi:hypothetical protein